MKKLLLILLFLPLFCYSQQILMGGGRSVQLGGKQGVTGFLPIYLDSLQLWLYGEKVTTSVGYVTTWNDQSGRGHNATQSTASYQPLYTASSINGHPALHFDSINDYLTLGTQLGKPANFTIFTVFRAVNVTNGQYVMWSATDVGGSAGYLGGWGMVRIGASYVIYNNSDGTHHNLGRTSNVVLYNNTYTIHSQRYTSGNNYCDIWENGITQSLTKFDSSATTNYGTAYEFVLGKRGVYNDGYLHGDIAEVIIYNISLSDVQRSMVEVYLSNKYAIPLVFGTPSFYNKIWYSALHQYQSV